MSRYRPPRAKGAPYITPEGAQRLRDELTTLWKDERPKVTAVVPAGNIGGPTVLAKMVTGVTVRCLVADNLVT